MRSKIFLKKPLGGKHLPIFAINRGRGLCKLIPDPYAMHFSCFGWKNVFPWRKSKPRCFRNASVSDSVEILHRSSSFFTVLRSFFVVLQSFNSFYAPLVVPTCFVYFVNHFHPIFSRAKLLLPVVLLPLFKCVFHIITSTVASLPRFPLPAAIPKPTNKQNIC